MKRLYSKQEIARTLDKFMAGETSLDEERMLAAYFRTHKVEEAWRDYKEMFALFDSGAVDIGPASQSSRHAMRWLMAGIAAGVLLPVCFFLLVKEDGPKQSRPVVVQQMKPQPPVKEAKPLPVTAQKPVALKPKPRKQKPEVVEAAVEQPAAQTEEPAALPLIDIDMEAVRQQGEDLRVAMAIMNQELLEME